MSTNTTNYNLVKPATTDFYDVAVQNGNMDIIDAELADKIDKSIVTAVNDFIVGSGAGAITKKTIAETRTLLEVNATDILTKIKTVDGSGSGLDADLLDGVESTGYCRDNPIVTTITTGFASGYSGTITVRKNHNNLVQVKGDLTKTTDIAFFGSICTLAVGIRPSDFIMIAAHLLDASLVPIVGNDSYLSIAADGALSVYSVGTTTNARRIVFELMYYAA